MSSGSEILTFLIANHNHIGQFLTDEVTLSRDSTLRRTIATLPHPQTSAVWVTKHNSSSLRSWNQNHKIPPEVPKRTSSISTKSNETRIHNVNGLNKTKDNGSLSSVQSSGSDSSLSTDRITCENSEVENHRCSPIWKRKDQVI
ncbi:unnamed protein product, partial [Timema podura]|nr:unnamed protein product [Timema podura]